MKGKKTDLGTKNCAIARTLNVIGDWWSLLIVRDALRGTQRFNEFQAQLGLARNILSARLKKLVDKGILKTVPDGDGSRHHAYALTERGESLGIVLVALWQWGEENCFQQDELQKTVFDSRSGERIAKLALKTESGHHVAPSQYMIAAKVAR